MGATIKVPWVTLCTTIIGAVAGFFAPFVIGKLYNAAVGFEMIPTYEEFPSATCPYGNCWNNPWLGPGPEMALNFVTDWGLLSALAGGIVAILLFRRSLRLASFAIAGVSAGIVAFWVLLTFNGA